MVSSSEEITYLNAPGDALIEEERVHIAGLASTAACRFCRPRMVNLGVGRGGTMHCLRYGCKCGWLVGVDMDYHRPRREVVAPELLNAEFVQGITWEVGRMPWYPVHVLVVDACHRRECVEQDIRAWRRHIPVGGFIAFHDYKPSSRDMSHWPHLAGVKLAVDECLNEIGKFVMIEIAGSVASFEREG